MARHTRMHRRARRLRCFQLHLAGYFAVMIALFMINRLTTPENPWFVVPMVGWGAPLAIHAAYVLELFGRRGK